MTPSTSIASSLLALCLGASLSAGVTTFFDDKQGWDALAGNSSQIGFVSPSGQSQQVYYDFYWAQHGIWLGSVQKPNGCDWYLEATSWATDGWMAYTASGYTSDPHVITFDTPQRAFAQEEWVTFLDPVCLDFYFGDLHVGSSCVIPQTFFPAGIHFVGWVTDFDFDRIAMNDSDGVDAIYIVPAPPAILALTSLLAIGRRRRRVG